MKNVVICSINLLFQKPFEFTFISVSELTKRLHGNFFFRSAFFLILSSKFMNIWSETLSRGLLWAKIPVSYVEQNSFVVIIELVSSTLQL